MDKVFDLHKSFKDYEDCFDTLKRTSLDDANNEYMTESEIEVLNFDAVKTAYIEKINKNLDSGIKKIQDPKSVDALFVHNNKLIFIEFKNGDFSQWEIMRKIKNTLFIFFDITKTDISFSRKNIQYYIVYNENIPCVKKGYPLIKIKNHLEMFNNYLFEKVFLIKSSELSSKLENNVNCKSSY